MVSRGETRRHFRWGMVNAAVVIPAFMIGVRWGAVGVAVGYVVASYILLIPSLMYAFAGSAITLGSFLRALAPSFLCSLVAAAPTLALRYWIGLDSQWAALASSAVFVVAYFAVSMSRPPFRANLQRVGATIRRKSVVDRGRG
jgi:hypothetical protein